MARHCTVCDHRERRPIDKGLVSGHLVNRPSARRSITWPSRRSAAMPRPTCRCPWWLRLRPRTSDRRSMSSASSRRSTPRAWLCSPTRDASVMATWRLKAVDRVQRQIELQAKLLGELDERPHINIALSAECLQIRAIVLDVLRDDHGLPAGAGGAIRKRWNAGHDRYRSASRARPGAARRAL